MVRTLRARRGLRPIPGRAAALLAAALCLSPAGAAAGEGLLVPVAAGAAGDGPVILAGNAGMQPRYPTGLAGLPRGFAVDPVPAVGAAPRAWLDPAVAAPGASGGERLAGLRSGLPSSLWEDPRPAWAVAAAGWLVALTSMAGGAARTRRATRRAREDVARVMRARDRLAAAHADLARSNAGLELANEQLERFNNVAAHDLRAPLRALMTLPGWVREELAEAGIRLPGEVSGLLDDMFDQAAGMDRMLKDLLDYARLGGEVADRRRFRPAERIRDLARMAGMPDEFTLEIAADLPELELSTVEFDTVMRNLLSNAVRHHDRPNGRIAVRGRIERGTAVLEVEDDGPGIAPEHRARVFEIFSTLGGRDGGGMGLAFVRRIVESWGGRVTVRSPGRGRGSVFRLTVPSPAALPRAARGGEIAGVVSEIPPVSLRPRRTAA